jgi:hypothetical protein
MRISPGYGPLVTGKHAGTTLDAVFKLEVNLAQII